MPSTPWILSIDFGTSYTVAAAQVGDRAPEVIEVGGERRMPSVVMVESAASFVVGRPADDLSASNPANTLRAPKNRLGDQAPVVLGGRPYQVVQLVAALLQQVHQEAQRQMGSPPTEVRLTHPATWNRPRLNRLLEAATKAGIDNAGLVPEPVAAALSYASEVGVAEGAFVVVYDLGGGTFDTAVVTARGGGFGIVGRPGGDQNIGGELFDELLVNHLGERLPADAWEQIQVADDPKWQRVAAGLRTEARRAKEILSAHPYADVIVPLPDGLVQERITREEFEELVTPYIEETVTLLGRCIGNAGLDAAQLAGIYVVGGASRSPIVERMVQAAYPGVPVSRRGDPKTSVALGAARAVRTGAASAPPVAGRTTQEAAPNTADQPLLLGPPSNPGPAAPVSHPGATAPGSDPGRSPFAAPLSDPGRAAATLAPGHSSVPPGPPSHPGITSAPPAGPSSIPPLSGGSFPPVSVAPGPPGGRAKRSSLLVPLLVVLGAAIVGFGGFLLLTRGGGDTGTGDDEGPENSICSPFDPQCDGAATTTDASGTSTPVVVDQALIDSLAVTEAEIEALYDGADWTEQQVDPTNVVYFCDIVPTETAALVTATAFNNADGQFVYSRIDHYEHINAAVKVIGQDESLLANCTSDEQELNGVTYVMTLADARDRFAGAIEGDYVALAYDYAPSDPESDAQRFAGIIIEKRDGSSISTLQLEVPDATVAEMDTTRFAMLVDAFYHRTQALG